MKKKFSRRDFLKTASAGLAGATLLGAAGCGGSGGEGSGGADLSDATFTVGSKEFTEQLILGQITLQVLENAGAQVNDKTGLTGSTTVRNALLSGEIDMYWEYTGTAWITFLGHTEPLTDSQEQFQAVAKEDSKKNNIHWVYPYIPANNTYAIGVRSETYDRLGVETISDYARLVEKQPDEATMCAASEFLGRDDGWSGLQKAYNFKLPGKYLSKIQEGAIFNAIDEGNQCNFGQVTATDGRLQALDLETLEDDKNFFPIYNPALNVRQQVYKDNPKLKHLFAPIAKKLTTDALRGLNAQVDVDGTLPETAAQNWLSENGFV